MLTPQLPAVPGGIRVNPILAFDREFGLGLPGQAADPGRECCFSRWEALLDLYDSGRHAAVIQGDTSEVFLLAERWNWTPRATRSFLKRVRQSQPRIAHLIEPVTGERHVG